MFRRKKRNTSEIKYEIGNEYQAIDKPTNVEPNKNELFVQKLIDETNKGNISWEKSTLALSAGVYMWETIYKDVYRVNVAFANELNISDEENFVTTHYLSISVNSNTGNPVDSIRDLLKINKHDISNKLMENLCIAINGSLDLEEPQRLSKDRLLDDLLK